jgi:hypothetical protein
MKKTILFTLAALSILSLASSCSQKTEWKVQDGWAMKKEAGKSDFQKFFAIGVWNIPGYNKEAMEENPVGYRKKRQGIS